MSLNCFIQLVHRHVFDLLVINKPKVEQMIQAFEADGAEGGQAKEELCEASVLGRILCSAILVEARINPRSKRVDVGAALEEANICSWK